MALPALPRDFKEFLRLLNSHHVDYLLIGGYAVAVHGHIRATNDLDIWIRLTADNASRVESALRSFGFASHDLSPELFLSPNQIIERIRQSRPVPEAEVRAQTHQLRFLLLTASPASKIPQQPSLRCH